MLYFLAIGGYYSSPAQNLGEKGVFSSIIDGVSHFITTYWIFFSILFLLLLLILAYYINKKIRKKIEEDSSDNSGNAVSDAF